MIATKMTMLVSYVGTIVHRGIEASFFFLHSSKNYHSICRPQRILTSYSTAKTLWAVLEIIVKHFIAEKKKKIK